jgi:hypothetical protein
LLLSVPFVAKALTSCAFAAEYTAKCTPPCPCCAFTVSGVLFGEFGLNVAVSVHGPGVSGDVRMNNHPSSPGAGSRSA